MPAAPLLKSPPVSHRTRQRHARSVIIVGAGPGGLAAALLLAHAGVNVHIVEKQSRVGGRCSALEEEGFRFDLGPTFFLYPAVLERIFKLIGRDLHTDVPMVRLDPQYRIILGNDGDLLCTPNLERMQKEVAKFNVNDAANVGRFLSENRVKLERFRPVLESAFLGWSDLFKLSLLKLLPTLRPWASLDRELHRYFEDPRIRLAFSFQSKYLGMSPFNCPSLFSILSYLEYDFGVWHPIGGCSAVSEAMARIAMDMGVTISLNDPVTEVVFEGKKAVGVKTDSGTHLADAVVMNADFAQAMTKLVPDRLRRRWTDTKIAKKRYSCSTFMMYLGLSGEPAPLDHHTIYTSQNYVENLKDIEQRHVLSEDPSLYIQNAGVTDNTLAPPGQSTLYVLAPVTHLHGNVDWATQKSAFRATVLKQLQKLGLKDVESRIRFEKVLTPQCWQDDYDVYRGATFNLAHNLGQMLHLRPRNRFEDLDNMYLVGGGTHPGSGLPVIYESARITTRLLLDDLKLDSSWLDNARVAGAVSV
ncbi:phytoene desaturase [soil metagenome]